MNLAVRSLIAAGVLSLLVGGAASAGEFYKFSDEKFKQLQDTNQPILVEIDAGWCPICAKQRPIIDKLTETPELKNIHILVVSFDGQKDVVRAFGANMQSTLIVFHGAKETGRLVGETDRDLIKGLLEKAEG